MAEERFLKMKTGAVYRYSAMLAKRRDAVIVDGYAAAEYFRSIGSENEITKKFPKRDIDTPAPKTGKPRRKASPKAKTVVSDDKDSGLKELLGEDAENILTGN